MAEPTSRLYPALLPSLMPETSTIRSGASWGDKPSLGWRNLHHTKSRSSQGLLAEWRNGAWGAVKTGLRSYKDPARISRPGTSGSTWERIITYLPFLPATRLFNRHQIGTSARTRRFFPPGDWLHSNTNDQKFPGAQISNGLVAERGGSRLSRNRVRSFAWQTTGRRCITGSRTRCSSRSSVCWCSRSATLACLLDKRTHLLCCNWLRKHLASFATSLMSPRNSQSYVPWQHSELTTTWSTASQL